MELELSQIVAQILAFLIMVWVLKRYAWQPLLNIMKERSEKIAQEFSTIEKSKNELQQLQEEYRAKIKAIEKEAHAKFQGELGKAQRVAEEIHQQAQAQAQELLHRAEEEIQMELIKAKNTLKKEMVDLIVASTEKILSEKMRDEGQQKAYIATMLEEAKL